MRAIPLLLMNATVACGVALVVTGQTLPKQAEEPLRGGQEFCSEVEREVNLSAESGLITQDHANDVARHCYELYGGDQ